MRHALHNQTHMQTLLTTFPACACIFMCKFPWVLACF